VRHSVGLRAVNVGLPALIGTHRGRPAISAIAKLPVAGADELWLSRTGLEGDGQADLVDHGGPDKAVYAYPSEHLPAWAAELEQPELGPAPFGENLSTAGWTEPDVGIGDRWRWGDAVLEVCQPRWPCYKLAIHRGRGDISRLMKDNGRTGWYLRVLEAGSVPVAGPISVIHRHPAGVTVFAVHQAARPGQARPEEIEGYLTVDALADEWQGLLRARL
jgi:MOSC domain-containing protein YiiM